ncbi:hypothetical protein [Lentzea cavernae]|uniref:Uncharacterized protein n=1 Tax=Lentzea cavernae TaxID=2020703 RepID=A0ABQ3MS47_9PSEU|nr:hypothetical protein [Lentzea cavernae]GHH60042.1 hypothetical protein GCM10017774_83870 [Lentzea cavernae]
MQDDPHQFSDSVRDGIFDSTADDIQDLDHGGGHHAYPPYPLSQSNSGHRGRHDTSGAPSWVKVLLWTGGLLAIAGMGIIILGALGSFDAPDPSSTRLTPAFPDSGLPPGFPADALPPELQDQAFPASAEQRSSGGGLGLGLGLFFAGFLLSAIGALGHSTSARR